MQINLSDYNTTLDVADDISDDDLKNLMAEFPTKPETGIAGETGRSLARGFKQTAATAGTLMQVAGMEDWGELTEDYFLDDIGRYRPTSAVEAGVWETGEKEYERTGDLFSSVTSALKYGFSARKLASTLPETIVSLAATLGAAGAGFLVGGPVGAAAAAGVAGGALEGAQTYRELEDQGANDFEKRMGFAGVALGTGLLNALPVGMLFGKVPSKLGIAKLGQIGISALLEGTTETLEGPLEEAVKLTIGYSGFPEEDTIVDKLKAALKQELDVFIPAMLTGGGIGLAFPNKAAAQSIKIEKPILTEDEFTQVREAGIRPSQKLELTTEQIEVGLDTEQLTVLDKLVEASTEVDTRQEFLTRMQDTPWTRNARVRMRFGLNAGATPLTPEQQAYLRRVYKVEDDPAKGDWIIAMWEHTILELAESRGESPLTVGQEINVGKILTQKQAEAELKDNTLKQALSQKKTKKSTEKDLINAVVSYKQKKTEPGELDAFEFLINATTSANPTTAMHDLMHYITLSAQGPMKIGLEKTLLAEYNKKAKTKYKTIEAIPRDSKHWEGFHESTAYSFENYLHTGRAPDLRTRSLFNSIKETFQEIYTDAKQIMRGYMPLENQNFFNALLAGRSFSRELSQHGQTMEQVYGALGQRAPGGPLTSQTWQRTRMLAADVEKAREGLKIAKGEIPGQLKPEHLVSMDLFATESEHLMDLFIEGNATEQEQQAYAVWIGELNEALDSGLSSYAGLMLNTWALIGKQRELAIALTGMARKLTPSEARNLDNLDWNSLAQIKQFYDSLHGNKLAKWFKALWYSSVLSGPPTHLVNTISNGVMQAYGMADKAILGGVDALESTITGRPRQVYAHEALDMMVGALKSFTSGKPWVGLGHALRGQFDILSKWDQTFAGVGTAMEDLTEDFGAKIGGEKGRKVGKAVGAALNMPTRFLVGADIWFKTIAEASQRAALVYRIEKGGDVAISQLQKAEERVPEQQRKLEAAFQHRKVGKTETKEAAALGKVATLVNQVSQRYGEFVTFQTDPGDVTRSITRVRNQIPFAWVFMPFVNIVANVAKRGLELTPGFHTIGAAITYAQDRSKLRKWEETYGKAEPDTKVPPKPAYTGPPATELATKQIEAGVVAGLVLWMIAEGMITGPPPEDKTEREAYYRAGNQPYSFRVGEAWVDYRRFEPLGLPIAIITHGFEQMRRIQESNADPATKQMGSMDVFFNITGAIKDLVIDSTYLQGIAKAMASDKQLAREFPRVMAGFVPFSSFWRTMRKAGDAAQNGQVAIYQTDSFMDTFAQSLPPGLPTKLAQAGVIELPEARKDVFGQDVGRPSGFFREWLPYRWQIPTADPVENELARLGMYPGIPGRVVKLGRLGRYWLDEDLYEAYIVASGTELKEQFERIVRSPGYRSIKNDAYKAKRLEQVRSRIRSRELQKVKRKQARRVREQKVAPV